VKYLLQNRRYIGDVSYGWRETLWQSKADYGRQFMKDKPTHEQWDETLRIVSDEQFYAAQELIAKRAGRGGRPSHKHAQAADVLAEIFWCPKHRRRLSVCGASGKHLGCPACRVEDPKERCLFSIVNRNLARRILFTHLADQVRRDEGIVDQAIARAIELSEQEQRPDPKRVGELEKELKRLGTRSRS